jgi:hypothetical protein
MKNLFAQVAELNKNLYHACDSCGKITELRPYNNNELTDHNDNLWHLCKDCYPKSIERGTL